MKFSEKGLKSFDKQMTEIVLSNNFEEWDRFSAIRQVTFEPDDFKDCVVLTVEEAHQIRASLSFLWYLGIDTEVGQKCIALSDSIFERTEQTENCDDSN